MEHSLPRSEKSKNFRSMELSLLWNFRSSGANVPRTFVPWNFRTPGTFALQERMFKVLSFHGTFAPLEPSLHKQLSCPLTFAPEKFNLQTTQDIVDAVGLDVNVSLLFKRCVELYNGRMMPDFSLYSRNRGEPLSFINTGVSVRVKVQPTNINCCIVCCCI